MGPSGEIYRICFELVVEQAVVHYSKDGKQSVPNSQIPDEEWGKTYSMATEDPWAQYNQLKAWEKDDIEFVRNVRLERLDSQPRWVEVAQ